LIKIGEKENKCKEKQEGRGVEPTGYAPYLLVFSYI
jgi:hypothetical protein